MCGQHFTVFTAGSEKSVSGWICWLFTWLMSQLFGLYKLATLSETHINNNSFIQPVVS